MGSLMRVGLLAVHPFFFAAAFVLNVALSNAVEPAGFLRPLLLAVGITAVFIAIAWVLVRDHQIAAVIATAALLALASRGTVLSGLRILLGLFGTSWAWLALLITTMALASASIFLFRSAAIREAARGRMPYATLWLNVTATALLAVALLPAVPAISEWFDHSTYEPDAHADANGRPDIYLILLDGYARSDELERQFGIDNTDFLTGLANRHFAIDARSHSNYTYTGATLASLLTLDYLNGGNSGWISNSGLRSNLRAAAVDGAAVTWLHAAGYETVATAVGWEDVTLRGKFDTYLDRPELSELERILVQQTWIPDLPLIPSNWFFIEQAHRVDGILDQAQQLAMERRSYPIFALIHLPSPHLPMAFMADGSPVELSSRRYMTSLPAGLGLTTVQYRQAYAANIAQLDRKVLKAIDVIQASSSVPPVIVVFSDHGYNDEDPTSLQEPRLRNLFAAITPGMDGPLAEGHTPLSWFRALLHVYAGAPSNTQPDLTFIVRKVGDDAILSRVANPG